MVVLKLVVATAVVAVWWSGDMYGGAADSSRMLLPLLSETSFDYGAGGMAVNATPASPPWITTSNLPSPSSASATEYLR